MSLLTKCLARRPMKNPIEMDETEEKSPKSPERNTSDILASIQRIKERQASKSPRASKISKLCARSFSRMRSTDIPKISSSPFVHQSPKLTLPEGSIATPLTSVSLTSDGSPKLVVTPIIRKDWLYYCKCREDLIKQERQRLIKEGSFAAKFAAVAVWLTFLIMVTSTLFDLSPLKFAEEVILAQSHLLCMLWSKYIQPVVDIFLASALWRLVCDIISAYTLPIRMLAFAVDNVFRPREIAFFICDVYRAHTLIFRMFWEFFMMVLPKF